MKVFALAPFAVGIVPVHAPEPALTVVAKVSFSLSTGSISIDQEPLYFDDAGLKGTDFELERASDFAPRKGAVDVLLVGSARSPTPSVAWPFTIQIGDWRRRAYVASNLPAKQLRLAAPYVRTRPRTDAPLARVAPCHIEPPTPPIGPDFDYAAFNAAPLEQRLPDLRLGQSMELEGLLGDGAKVKVWLPEVLPAVFCVDGREVALVPTRLDTLVIDTDHDVGMLTWRGTIPRPSATAHLVLAEGIDAAPDWEHVASRFSEALMRDAQELAEGEAEATPPPPTPRAGVILGDSTRARLGQFALTPAPSSPAPPKSRPKRRPTRETLGPGNPLGHRPVLPFVARAGAPPAPVEEATADGPSTVEEHALPFPKAAAPRKGEPLPSAPSPPFPSLAAPPAPSPIRAPPQPSFVAPTAPTAPPALPDPSGPAPAPAPAPSDALLPIEVYAKVKVAILHDRRPLAQILEEQGLDEVQWRKEEQLRAEALSRSASTGDSRPVIALRRAMRRALDERKP